MKGKNVFTKNEEAELRRLILQRCQEPDKSKQKRIRDKMRAIGFYGGDDFHMSNMTLEKFDMLITSGKIAIVENATCSKEVMRSETTRAVSPSTFQAIKPNNGRADSDEYYVLDLCDEVLGVKGDRQHRFPFLKGDAGTSLPVDIYYQGLHLVVEYRELQHSENVPFFDNKETVSGVSRGEQRRIYDERRREVLPKYGIEVVEINYCDLAFGNTKKLLRNKERDLMVIRNRLKKYIE